jgi:hypothetical protein
MAKAKAGRRGRPVAAARKRAPGRAGGTRTTAKKTAEVRKTARKAAQSRPARKPAAKARSTRTSKAQQLRGRSPRLDRARRTLDELVPTPPSSLNLERRGSAARTGREELADIRRKHKGMSPEITSGDVDVDVEDAYFTGDAAPGGDNPTPDQDVVEDIGKALGVEYADNEELKSSDKLTERDKHRWELDPASSEDYKDRK